MDLEKDQTPPPPAGQERERPPKSVETQDATPPPEPAPDETVEFWQGQYQKLKASYDGLKGHASKEKNRADRMTLEHAALAEELETLKLNTSTQIADLTAQLQSAQDQAEQQETKATQLEKAQTLGKLIRRDFGQLADLYDEGLLLGIDGLEGDALTAYLTRYAQRMDQVVEHQKRQTHSGATPPPPPGQQSASMTLEDARAALQEATTQHGRNSDEYRRAYAQYTQIALAGDD